jgi:hypothetical protein
MQVEFSSPCSDGESIWFASLEVPKVLLPMLCFSHECRSVYRWCNLFTPDWSDFCSFLPSKRVPKSRVTLRTAFVCFLKIFETKSPSANSSSVNNALLLTASNAAVRSF